MNKVDLLDHGFVRLVESMGSDLSIVRAARVSYDAAWRAGEDQGSDRRLIRYLWRNHHTTPFEAVTFTFEVKAPIFVFRQWHRHRTWCLSGDTEISFERPDHIKAGIRKVYKKKLSDLYKQWNSNPPVKRQDKQKRTLQQFKRERISSMLLRVYDQSADKFTIGHICDVISSGVKQVFKIALADGKTLKCSKDHLLLTTDGWQTLESAVGLVVGRATAGMTKTAMVLTNGYAEGQIPWNKGVTGYKTGRVVTEEEKAVIRAARVGEKSNFWKGGVSSDRAKIAGWTTDQAPRVHLKFDYTCQDCKKRGGRLQAHHIKSVVDAPEHARDFDNLITLCKPCHDIRHGRTGDKAICRARGQILRAMASKIVSIRLVGEEPTFDISVEGPNHNFVANGMIVHNSYNELSARYRELPEEFYLPDPSLVGVQSQSNRQGRQAADEEVLIRREYQVQLIRDTAADAFGTYRQLLADGWPRELARSVLPVSTYSHMFATVDLLNLMKFLTLRCDSHAQYEIRVYADAMRDLVRSVVPEAIAAWELDRAIATQETANVG